MGKSNRFCVKKSYFLFGLLIILIGIFLFFSKDIANTKISYNSQASETNNLKAYFVVSQNNSTPPNYSFQTIYDGNTATTSNNTLTLVSQKPYQVCINTNKPGNIRYAELFGANTFGFSATGAVIGNGENDGPGCYMVTYNYAGTYEITGLYRTTVNNKQQVLYPATLNMVVKN